MNSIQSCSPETLLKEAEVETEPGTETEGADRENTQADEDESDALDEKEELTE